MNKYRGWGLQVYHLLTIVDRIIFRSFSISLREIVSAAISFFGAYMKIRFAFLCDVFILESNICLLRLYDSRMSLLNRLRLTAFNVPRRIAKPTVILGNDVLFE